MFPFSGKWYLETRVWVQGVLIAVRSFFSRPFQWIKPESTFITNSWVLLLFLVQVPYHRACTYDHTDPTSVTHSLMLNISLPSSKSITVHLLYVPQYTSCPQNHNTNSSTNNNHWKQFNICIAVLFVLGPYPSWGAVKSLYFKVTCNNFCLHRYATDTIGR